MTYRIFLPISYFEETIGDSEYELNRSFADLSDEEWKRLQAGALICIPVKWIDENSEDPWDTANTFEKCKISGTMTFNGDNTIIGSINVNNDGGDSVFTDKIVNIKAYNTLEDYLKILDISRKNINEFRKELIAFKF